MPSLIIGSNGFIGSRLKHYADTYLDNEYIGVTRSNYGMWKGRTYDKVIWVAGSASKRLSREQLVDDHILGVNLALRDFECETFIYVSSQAVYEDCAKYRKADESCKVRAEKLSDYAWAKYMGEKAVKAFKERWIIVRPNGFTGPGLTKNAVFDLASTPPQLFVSLDSRIQYMHVDRFAELILKHIAGGICNQIFNVTAKNTITPVDIAAILDVDLKKIKMPTSEVIPLVYAAMDVTKIENLLNIQMPESREAILNWNKPLY